MILIILSVFTKGEDIIALITGPINDTDIKGVNQLLEKSRHTRDADEFITEIKQAKAYSDNTKRKLDAFKSQLKAANNGKDVKKEDWYEFLKHFHLLGYDLGKEGSTTLSLLHSHIAQFNRDIPNVIWSLIVTTVQRFNKNGGTITRDNLPDELVEYFKEHETTHISKELAKEGVEHDSAVRQVPTDWNQHSCAKKLAIANIIGSWNDNNKADISVITKILPEAENYSIWIEDLRETLQIHDCPLSYKNGIWRFKERVKSWEALGSMIFDNYLDSFKDIIMEVLREDDPSFEMPGEERYAASFYGQVMKHSDNLRKGLAESLALIGSQPDLLSHCDNGRAEDIALSSVRELFEESDWVRWGSLNSILPTISEANPNEFLSATESAIAAKPSPFDRLFEEEGTGVHGRNYITGLLRALEGIAWEEDCLSETSVVLAEIAYHNPSANRENRAIASLTKIFLPWHPQTLASASKREGALKIICREQPEVGWKLLKSLLQRNSVTSGTYKPLFRKTIPDDWKSSVSKKEYSEQSLFCADLIVEQAGFDINKMAYLVGEYKSLPQPAAKALRDKLTSEHCLNLSEEERMPIWSALYQFIDKHKRYAKEEWSLKGGSLLPIEKIAKQLEPTAPSLLNKRFFSGINAYPYEEGRVWKEEEMPDIRKTAVEGILNEGELPKVLDFASKVHNSHYVGEALADLNQYDSDAKILPELLDMSNEKLWQFVTGYARRRWDIGKWEWFDNIDKTGWKPKQIGLLLCTFPFKKEAWDRATQLLGEENEGEYWKNTAAKTLQPDGDIECALVKLLEFGRPNAVIDHLSRDLFKENDINPDLACDTLLALVDSEELSDHNDITAIIKALQNNADTDQDSLFHVEWAYVAFLGRSRAASPLTLENRLASNPDFFCELIQLAYFPEGSEEEKESTEQSCNKAKNVSELLSVWSIVPGAPTNAEFNPDAFTKWLNSVEETTKALGIMILQWKSLAMCLLTPQKGQMDYGFTL
ncbi:MAG: hypothetical protein QS721_14855 [Candidatus Endonucleobacter sp. (ex Gigantidas childressi)]|nr:hypothetical protein [Candidatus Endonucleobacter sp. (ex Gigantidas childressi)]